MRFISKYGGHCVVIQHDVQEAYATGMAKVVQPLIEVKFAPWQLTPYERELAIARWVFNGFYLQEDQVTVVPPDHRIGLYDSIADQEAQGYSDEIRELIERELIANALLTDTIIAVPASSYPPPWPRYDDFAGTNDELLERLVEDGHELGAVLEYERANQNRDELVSALQNLIDDPDALLELQPVAEEIVG
jgi:hypothetical protein